MRVFAKIIADDLAEVAYACDRVAVMYVGRTVDLGATRDVYLTPRHPYTDALMSAVPETDPNLPMRPLFWQASGPTRPIRRPVARFRPVADMQPTYVAPRLRNWLENPMGVE